MYDHRRSITNIGTPMAPVNQNFPEAAITRAGLTVSLAPAVARRFESSAK